MRRLLIVVMILGCIAFVAGCHSDTKQATKIHEKMEASVSYEKKFAKKQEDLNTYREKGQSVYNDLLDLDIQDEETIQQKLDDANTYMKKQKKLLAEAKENFQKAYDKVASIEKNVGEIEDQAQKEQASSLLDIMQKRKNCLDAFFDDYQAQLKLLNAFYDRLDDGELSIEELSDQTDQLDDRYQDMEEVIKTFNKYTEQYNETENKYYKMADRT